MKLSSNLVLSVWEHVVIEIAKNSIQSIKVTMCTKCLGENIEFMEVKIVYSEICFISWSSIVYYNRKADILRSSLGFSVFIFHLPIILM